VIIPSRLTSPSTGTGLTTGVVWLVRSRVRGAFVGASDSESVGAFVRSLVVPSLGASVGTCVGVFACRCILS